MIDGSDPDEFGKLEKYRALGSYEEILVDDRLAEELERAGVTGLSLRSVYAVMENKRQIKQRWKQLCASHIVPPMSPRSTGIDWVKKCGSCGRSGFYWNSPTRLVYQAQDLASSEDVNRTWEHHGVVQFESELFARLNPNPLFLVTPKVRRIFRDAGVTEFDWIPIRVVEDE